jgi:E3 SUMO-protein ligase PIAS1
VQLQQIIKALSENGIASLTKTGRKQELIDRIVVVVQDIQRDGRLDKWQKARNILSNRNRSE